MSGAGACASASSLHPVPPTDPRRVFLLAETAIATDLITPLGAYLRLRAEGRASFLLESVEHGRLGRHSFVGSGTRLCTFTEAEACGEAVVGYLGYDFAATPEPTGSPPGEG